jgi:type II secretory pathway predicted ATPase ExeA
MRLKIDPSVLETIRLLSDFETSRNKLLQILLIGQPQLARKLADPALVQLEQRIAVFARRPVKPPTAGGANDMSWKN